MRANTQCVDLIVCMHVYMSHVFRVIKGCCPGPLDAAWVGADCSAEMLRSLSPLMFHMCGDRHIWLMYALICVV